MVNGALIRGEKWSKIRKKAEFEGKTVILKWLDSQKSIVDDIKEYEKSLEAPIEEAEEEKETKSKKKK